MQIKTKIVSWHTAVSKPVKQEVNSTLILPPLVFPAHKNTHTHTHPETHTHTHTDTHTQIHTHTHAHAHAHAHAHKEREPERKIGKGVKLHPVQSRWSYLPIHRFRRPSYPRRCSGRRPGPNVIKLFTAVKYEFL